MTPTIERLFRACTCIQYAALELIDSDSDTGTDTASSAGSIGDAIDELKEAYRALCLEFPPRSMGGGVR